MNILPNFHPVEFEDDEEEKEEVGEEVEEGEDVEEVEEVEEVGEVVVEEAEKRIRRIRKKMTRIEGIKKITKVCWFVIASPHKKAPAYVRERRVSSAFANTTLFGCFSRFFSFPLCKEQ